MGIGKVIYTVEHSITGHVIYVGACSNLLRRYCEHGMAPSDRMKNAILEAEAEGAELRMGALDFGGPDVEAYWIEQMYAWGFPLINVVHTPKSRRARKTKNVLLTTKPSNP